MTNRNKMLGGNKNKIINSKGKEFIHLIGEIGECILNRTTIEDKKDIGRGGKLGIRRIYVHNEFTYIESRDSSTIYK